jgi:class 3 adenylate cyclase
VHTGLGIVQAIATLNTRLAAQYGVELAVRLGIHTGPVVVGVMGVASGMNTSPWGKRPTSRRGSRASLRPTRWSSAP